MHESTKLEHNARGFETSDANIGAVAKFGGALAVICGIALVLMVVMLSHFRSEKKTAEPAISPFAVQREPMPPAPRLQIQPEAEWANYKTAEDSLAQSYGWISREAGVVRLPIDRALELVAQRGLPARVEARGSKIEIGGSRP